MPLSCSGVGGCLFVFGGEEAAEGGRKPFHANRSKHRLPSHMGDRSGGPGGSLAPHPLPARRTAGISPLTLQLRGGDSAAFLPSLLLSLRGVGFNHCL